MSLFFGMVKQPARWALALATMTLALSACKRPAETPPKPATEAPAAPAAGVAPEPSEGHVAVPATGPGEGGTAVGGVVANQDAGGAAKGNTPAPTGGDGATTRPATPPSK
jgi:hypothetical protein